MDQNEEQKKLVQVIRLGYEARCKLILGETLTPREVEILDFLDPIDVTYVLIQEITSLEHQIVRLIYENAVLQERSK